MYVKVCVMLEVGHAYPNKEIESDVSAKNSCEHKKGWGMFYI